MHIYQNQPRSDKINGDIPNVYTWWAQRSKTSNRVANKITKSDMIDSGDRQDHGLIVLEIDL